MACRRYGEDAARDGNGRHEMTPLPRVALIGAGRIGQLHARNLATLRDSCELVGIADWDMQVAESTARLLGVPLATADSESLLTSPEVDAVIIASSTATHAPYIELAASHGKDIFTEKPIALEIETTASALDAVHRAGVRLQVGFQRRFDSGYVAANESVRKGEIGRVEMIRDAMRDPSPPNPEYLRSSGGLYRDMTIHNFDAVRWLMDEEPFEVYAAASALVSDDIRDADDIDTSIVTLRFPSGAIASIENSRRSGFGYDVRTEIFGSEGALMVGEYRYTPIRRFSASGVHEDHQHFFLERFRDAYRREITAFLDALHTDSPVPVTGEDGMAALRLAYAAEESRRSGRPVAVNLKEEIHERSEHHVDSFRRA
jgi:myo-inositol 2-dehydrogenase / D-chiro-inositol 1-dehydrogenase